MDKPFIAYAGIDKITIGNGRNGKAYDVSVELAAAAPALLEALEAMLEIPCEGISMNYDCDDSNLCGVCNRAVAARAAIAQAKGESHA